MTHSQLTNDRWKFIDAYLPIGGFGPYPERSRPVKVEEAAASWTGPG